MAHSLSAKKRVRQNVKRRALNRAHKSTLKTKLRQCMDLFQHGTVDQAEQAVHVAIRTLDRESNRRTLHRNAAARRKSRLMKRLNNMRAKAAS